MDMIKTWKDREGIVELIHRFHDLATNETNFLMRQFYWKHYRILFKLWFRDIDLILGDRNG